MRRRVAVTGLGMITAIGCGREAFWSGLLQGRDGFSEITSFDTSAFPVHRGAEVRGYEPRHFLSADESRTMDRASQFASSAARMSLADAGLPFLPEPERTAVILGTTSGEPGAIERLDDAILAGRGTEAEAAFISRYPCQWLAVHVARTVGATGPNLVIPTACAAGNYALAHAYDLLASGDVSLALAGGSDAFSRITYTGFARLGAIAPDVCRPFDRRRKGMIPGEGACVLVLEPLDSAAARGARIYAELLGYGISCDAHHMTAGAPDGDGALRAMQAALRSSRVPAREISYISAHGTGTIVNDSLEALALHRLFDDCGGVPPVSSIKSMLGHTMGAASALEAAACALALSDGWMPPTVHINEPDPLCALDCVPNHARKKQLNFALNNAHGFGGGNASLVFGKYDA